MKKAILMIVFAVLLGADLSAQSTRRQKRSTKPMESPCGVPIPTFAEYQQELKVEWREIGDTPDSTVYYNTRKTACDKGTLKTWIKSVQKETGKPLFAYSLTRYELNCRTSQLRATSKVLYAKDGAVFYSFEPAEAPVWDDVVPDSIGEHIWQTICHKSY